MTVNTELETILTDTTDGDGEERCAVCKHSMAWHDTIGLRFCAATQANALSRHCICSTQPTS